MIFHRKLKSLATLIPKTWIRWFYLSKELFSVLSLSQMLSKTFEDSFAHLISEVILKFRWGKFYFSKHIER